jgi:hypothetical protein
MGISLTRNVGKHGYPVAIYMVMSHSWPSWFIGFAVRWLPAASRKLTSTKWGCKQPTLGMWHANYWDSAWFSPWTCYPDLDPPNTYKNAEKYENVWGKTDFWWLTEGLWAVLRLLSCHALEKLWKTFKWRGLLFLDSVPRHKHWLLVGCCDIIPSGSISVIVRQIERVKPYSYPLVNKRSYWKSPSRNSWFTQL